MSESTEASPLHLFLTYVRGDEQEAVEAQLQRVLPLFTALGPNVPIIVSATTEDTEGAEGSIRFDSRGVHIGLDPTASTSTLAHEVMHLLLDLEGYPTLTGAPGAGHMASALLDCAVDRRIALRGFDVPKEMDRYVRMLAVTPLETMTDRVLLQQYVAFLSGRLTAVAVRDQWVEDVRFLRPAVASVGDEILSGMKGGQRMWTAAGALVALTTAAGILATAGYGEFIVAHAGPEFEEYRRTTWPHMLAEYLERSYASRSLLPRGEK